MPTSAGESETITPAALKASIFPVAVPMPPLTTAPACPIRRPGGAVTPPMKATVGFFIGEFLINSAASYSAVPPISPMRMIYYV